MIADIHSHKLPGIDDGSENMEMTLKMLRNAERNGTREIVATPHYLLEYGDATINEVKALAQRLHVAELLKDKKTYSEIAEITGASTATISRVNRCLNYGSDGYKMVLERLKDEKID